MNTLYLPYYKLRIKTSIVLNLILSSLASNLNNNVFYFTKTISRYFASSYDNKVTNT